MGMLRSRPLEWQCLLFHEDIVEHLHDDREVLALIVGREYDGVLVLGVGTHLAGRWLRWPVLGRQATTLGSFGQRRESCRRTWVDLNSWLEQTFGSWQGYPNRQSQQRFSGDSV